MTETTERWHVLAARAAVELRSEWSTLVELTLALPEDHVKAVAGGLSVHTKVGVDSIERKMNSVRHAASLGFSADDIIAAGQEKTVSTYLKSRRQEKYSDVVRMQFEVPGFLRELISQDLARIKKTLGIATSEDLFDFLHSVFENWTDEEIRQLAEGKP